MNRANPNDHVSGGKHIPGSPSRHEVVVIGAGQAGISLSYFLRQLEVDHVVIEKDKPFSAWHNRWDGFYANTPNWMNTLPGFKGRDFPGVDRNGFATREELVDYFEGYAVEVGAPILSGQDVVETTQNEEGRWTVRTSAGREFECNNVVVCTGAMSTPRIPEFAQEIGPDITQMHSVDYRRPSDIKTRNVLVVGSGSSGVQICKELLGDDRFDEVHLSTSDVLVLPEHFLGIQIHRLLHMFGIFDIRVHSRLGRMMYGTLELKGDPIRPPTPKDLSRTHGLKLHGRFLGANGDSLKFAKDETMEGKDLTIIWSTGFVGEYSWIKPESAPLELDERGYPVHWRGVLDKHPGLYFVGLRYQHTVASHDIYGVGNDAEYVANKILERRSDELKAKKVDNEEPIESPASALSA